MIDQAVIDQATSSLQGDESVLLLGITGSTAHGLSGPDSDTDFAGIYLAPTEHVLSLGFNQAKGTRGGNEPDAQLHELGKYLGLALKGNPTVIELLYLTDYLIKNPLINNLLAMRHRLHGQRTVRAAYAGYATHQAKRLLERTDAGKHGFSSDLTKRTAKHGRHCFRLMMQCRQLLTDGELTVDVSEHREQLFAMGALAVEDPQAFYQAFEAERSSIDTIKSVMPEEPDLDAANDYLIGVRKFVTKEFHQQESQSE